MRKLRKHYDGHPGLYLTADLESPLADMHFDDIDFAASLTEAERRLYALPDDHIYVVYKVRE